MIRVARVARRRCLSSRYMIPVHYPRPLDTTPIYPQISSLSQTNGFNACLEDGYSFPRWVDHLSAA